jgi:drug/metabolite transporter (DMT)-like permease
MLFYVAVFGTAVYYFLNQYTIKHSSPVIASLTLYLQPVFTFAWAHILLGEKLTFQFICGTILIFLGVTLTSGVFKKAR